MDQESAAKNWLIAVLQPHASLVRARTEPGDGFELAGERFTVLSDSGMSATFDRLVDGDGCVVGIQCWPAPSLMSRIRRLVASSPHVRVLDQPPVLHVYFVPTVVYHELASGGEQSMVGHLLVGTGGTVIVAVDLSELLADGELASLQV